MPTEEEIREQEEKAAQEKADSEARAQADADAKAKLDADAAAAAEGANDSDEVKRLKSTSRGLHKQIHERDTELAELREYKTEREKKKREKDEAAALKAGDHEKVIAARDKEIEELKKDNAKVAKTALTNEALAKLGAVTSVHAKKRMADLWAVVPSADRDKPKAWDDFEAALKKDDPGAFDPNYQATNNDRGGAPEHGSKITDKNPLVVKDKRGHHDLHAMSKNIAAERAKMARR